MNYLKMDQDIFEYIQRDAKVSLELLKAMQEIKKEYMENTYIISFRHLYRKEWRRVNKKQKYTSNITNEFKTEIETTSYRLERHPYATIAEVRIPTELNIFRNDIHDDLYIFKKYSVIVKCGAKDNFSKKKGREIAVEKLLKEVQKDVENAEIIFNDLISIKVTLPFYH